MGTQVSPEEGCRSVAEGQTGKCGQHDPEPLRSSAVRVKKRGVVTWANLHQWRVWGRSRGLEMRRWVGESLLRLVRAEVGAYGARSRNKSCWGRGTYIPPACSCSQPSLPSGSLHGGAGWSPVQGPATSPPLSPVCAQGQGPGLLGVGRPAPWDCFQPGPGHSGGLAVSRLTR